MDEGRKREPNKGAYNRGAHNLDAHKRDRERGSEKKSEGESESKFYFKIGLCQGVGCEGFYFQSPASC